MPNSAAIIAHDHAIVAAVNALRQGQIVVYPTETFYGLAADPFSPDAMDRLFALKGRDSAKTVALIAPDAASAFALASDVPAIARRLSDRFWPGPLTLVLAARIGLHDSLIGPDGGVGVRVSPHSIASALAAGLGHPITATSANLAGEPPATTVAAARAAFSDRVSVYLDGGELTATTPSTIVVCDHNGWRVIRAGAIATDQIIATLDATEPR
ncbi:MAG TPA: L-threonylcarbamoyladenylate synthase [Candidatus Binataceae bacterium]|nr:L-threonylcarbamoyladenylate synthase [Candidatus Binataceae bacterium]